MNRPADLRWAILGSLFLLGVLVVVGIVRRPSIREADTVVAESDHQATTAVSDHAVFPLRSSPRPTRPLDDSFQPTVGEEDGEPIAF